MNIIKCLSIVVIILVLSIFEVKAESQDTCAIWLCLPGGFPQGCAGAYEEFKNRIKHGKPPLPELSSCSSGGAGGKYELGYDRWVPCKEGYVLRESSSDEMGLRAQCYEISCAPQTYRNGYNECASYEAVSRAKPSYVKMWVDGEYLGQFFYE